MELNELALCPECDQRYPIHRLWCDHCGEGLTGRAKALTDSEARLLGQKLHRAMELYGQVLHDLEDLSGTDRVEPWLHDEIRSFYKNRLRQTKAEKRALPVRKCLVSAHDLAIEKGDFEGALSRLRKGLDQSPEVTVFKEMIEEIRGQMKEMEALTRVNDAAGAPEIKERIQAASAPEQGEKVPDAFTAMAAEAARIKTPETKPAPFVPSFVQEEEVPSPVQRFIEGFSEWSRPLRPFLLDNIGWFVGVFLVIAGYVALLTTFWVDIEGNRLLRQFLLFLSLFLTTGLFFSLAYYMRVRYPKLETSSSVVLIIVSLLTPLVFIAAVLISLVPA